MRVHTWEMTKEVDQNGYYVLAKHLVVEFIFENISELTLNGFSRQNVVFGVDVEKIESGFRLILQGCYGMEGHIEAEKLSLHLAPGKPV
jgi:hypothetical protein